VEKTISFEISGEQYTLFIEGIFKKRYYLQKKEAGSMFAEPIPVKVSASTLKDSVAYWLEILKTYMCKKSRKKGRCTNGKITCRERDH
jgi:hypothetical protein